MMNYNKGMLRRPEVHSSIKLKILFDSFAIRQMSPHLTPENSDKLREYILAIEKTTCEPMLTKVLYDSLIPLITFFI
jgi:hypothetical protein